MQLDTRRLKRYDLANMPELRIVRRMVREHGYEYPIIMVEGRTSDGLRIRKRFKSEEEARSWKGIREIQALNEHSEFHPVVTKLTQQQITEAENAFNRLGTRYSLTSALDFFLKHCCEPDVILSLEDALARFLEAKAGHIRDRSRVQLKSTLSQFKEFSEN
jgi:hypothetical protein